MTALGPIVYAFFEQHLKGEKGLSPASVRSYRDALQQYGSAAADRFLLPVARVLLTLWVYPAAVAPSAILIGVAAWKLHRRGDDGAAVAWSVLWLAANAIEVAGKWADRTTSPVFGHGHPRDGIRPVAPERPHDAVTRRRGRVRLHLALGMGRRRVGGDGRGRTGAARLAHADRHRGGALRRADAVELRA